MSYENALSTQLLALYCCCCSRPLRDPESIQIGIGPICREKYGWGADVSPAAKKAANVLTEEAAKPSTSNDRRLEIALEITELGFTVLGRRIAETFLRDSSKEAQAKVSKLFISEVTVKISLDALYDANVPDSKMLVNAPYVKGVTQVFNADIKAAAVVKAEWSRGSGAQGRDIFLGWGTTARYRAAIWPVIVKHFAGGTLEVYRNHILVSSAVIPLSAREDVESVDEVPADLRAAPGEAAPVKPAAIKEIRFEAGLFIIEAPYDSNLVAAVKALPYQDRKWDGARKVWTVTLPAFGAARTGRILQMSEIAARFNLKADCLADLDKTAFAMETARLAAVARDSAAARTEGDERMMNAAPLVGRRTFQLEGIRFLAGSPEGILPNVRLLADDMGLGKTWQVLLALSTSEGAVVVVPASVKYNWAKELAHLRPDLRCEVLEGKNSWRWPADGEVIFLNYDILPERFGPKGGTKKKPAEPVLNAEDHNRGRRTTLVVDEAQGVRNPEALRTTRIKTLRALCKRTWFLTGTPIENRTKDLWYMIAALGVEKQVFGSFEEYMGLVGAYKETDRKSVV